MRNSSEKTEPETSPLTCWQCKGSDISYQELTLTVWDAKLVDNQIHIDCSTQEYVDGEVQETGTGDLRCKSCGCSFHAPDGVTSKWV